MDKQASLSLLIEGNERYVSEHFRGDHLDIARRRDLADNGQHPFALIVGCSDSRVPPEVIFDCGLGDLFVIRTAGNVVDEVGLGSIEYGVAHLGIPLVVVLGHEDCGAVKATVGGGAAHGFIQAIVDKISVSYKKVSAETDVQCACEDENIRHTVAQICEDEVIAELIREGKTYIIGAKECIRSGYVSFLNKGKITKTIS